MSNNNGVEENSSNISCNPGPSSSVEQSSNEHTTNLENNNKASSIPLLTKLCDIFLNQAKTVTTNKETNLSLNQNAGASSNGRFNPGTSQIPKSGVNLTTTVSQHENINQNLAIPQCPPLYNNQTNIVNAGHTTLTPANPNQKQTGLPFEPSACTQLKEQILQVNDIARISIHNLHPTDNIIIAQAAISNISENPTNPANTTPGASVNGSQIAGTNELQSECPATRVYLTNNPSGLPYQSSQTEQSKPEPGCAQERRPDRIRTVATIPPPLYYNPPDSIRDSVTSTRSAPNVTPSENVVSERTITSDADLSDQPESDIIVNITPPPVPPCVIQGPPPIAGAPPTYSAIMRLGCNDPCLWTQSIRIQPSPPFIAPIPPPPYTEVQGAHGERPVLVASVFPTFSADQMLWGPDPISVVCPRCGNVVITATESQRSNLTHFSALALCLCGCWPCCLLPYCMDSCKNTYHHCPTCQQFLGMYRPW